MFPQLLGRISPKFEWRILLAYSLPITVGELSYYIFRWSDTFLLSLYRSPSEVGIYNAALRTTLLLNLLAVSVNALYSPIIADHYHHKRYKELQEILRTLLRWSMTLALPIVLAMALLSGDILSLWGRDFLVGSPALSNLAFSQLIFIASNILAFTLLMSGKQYIEVGNTVFVAVLNVLINLLLIPHYGISGAAISMLVSQGVVFILRILEIRFILNISLFTPKYLKPLVALVPVSILAYIAKRSIVELAPSSIFGSPLAIFVLIVPLIALVYLMVLYILKFEEEDILVWEELHLRKTISAFARIKGLEK
jgi:O-antigen/teichoic acid export membrane protein